VPRLLQGLRREDRAQQARRHPLRHQALPVRLLWKAVQVLSLGENMFGFLLVKETLRKSHLKQVFGRKCMKLVYRVDLDKLFFDSDFFKFESCTGNLSTQFLV
jgi:hypothetical protein